MNLIDIRVKNREFKFLAFLLRTYVRDPEWFLAASEGFNRAESGRGLPRAGLNRGYPLYQQGDRDRRHPGEVFD